MGNPLDGDARQSAGKANRTSSRKIYSALLVTYFNKETVKAVIKATPLCGIVYTLRRRNLRFAAIFCYYGINPGQKSVKELSYSGSDRQTKEKTAAKAQGC